MTKTVQIHCPSTGQTVDNFIISPFQTHDQVLQGVRLRFDISYAALYTVDAKPISNAQSLQEDQRVLVAAKELEHMLPDAPAGFALYDGEEGDHVDADVEGFGQDWEDLTEREKCDHIQSLAVQKPTMRNTLRITRPWQSVHNDLNVLQTHTSGDLDTQSSPSDCEALIEQRWRTTIEHFLPASLSPAKIKVAGKFWNPHVLAVIAVLGSFTQGQSHLVRGFLQEAVNMRLKESEGNDTSSTVQKQDVIDAITIIYERAGIIPAKLTKRKSAKAKGKERRKALKVQKKKGGNGDMSSETP
ncbi:hypothetical protein BKA66DRAFT_559538 [Pyrenochaeta sp. MPI-SDFR-AT-0127]|nr:hypothetical protein BKA66DRAFT_559538 [Pyrenochaeta sp. MPI-SDFR-AT-0127]